MFWLLRSELPETAFQKNDASHVSPISKPTPAPARAPALGWRAPQNCSGGL